MTRPALKERFRMVIFEADTPAGKLFDVLLLVAILFSVTLTMLQSVASIRAQCSVPLQAANALFTGLFTIEYIVRLWCARNAVRYARSFFGMVDLLAVLPFYLSPLIPGTGFLDVVKVLRMLRIFHVLKMAQFVGEENLLLKSLIGCRRKIVVFLVAVMTIVTIIGSLMYIIEGEANGFSSIPRSVYWAIVTITTVGYGDISPQTPLGQALAAFLMIIAYSIIAVPAGIITAEIGMESSRRSHQRACAACGHDRHDPEATYCCHCGAALSPHP